MPSFENGVEVLPLKGTRIQYLSWSPNGRLLAFWRTSTVSDKGGTEVIDLDKRTRQEIDPGGYSPCWTPDGKGIITIRDSDTSGRVTEVSLTGANKIEIGDTVEDQAPAITGAWLNARTLIYGRKQPKPTGHYDNHDEIAIWDRTNAQEGTALWTPTNDVYTPTISSDKQYIAYIDRADTSHHWKCVKVLDYKRNNLVYLSTFGSGSASQLCWDTHKQTLYGISGDYDDDQLYALTLASNSLRRMEYFHGEVLDSLTVNSDGLMAVAAFDGHIRRIRVYNSRTGRCIAVSPKMWGADSVALSEDGKRIAFVRFDGDSPQSLCIADTAIVRSRAWRR